MTNVTFIFETSPNTNLWKKSGDMAYYVTPV